MKKLDIFINLVVVILIVVNVHTDAKKFCRLVRNEKKSWFVTCTHSKRTPRSKRPSNVKSKRRKFRFQPQIKCTSHWSPAGETGGKNMLTQLPDLDLKCPGTAFLNRITFHSNNNTNVRVNYNCCGFS